MPEGRVPASRASDLFAWSTAADATAAITAAGVRVYSVGASNSRWLSLTLNGCHRVLSPVWLPELLLLSPAPRLTLQRPDMLLVSLGATVCTGVHACLCPATVCFLAAA